MSCSVRITHESGHLQIYFSFIVAHTHFKKIGSLIQNIQLTFLDAERIPNVAAVVLLLTTVAGLALAHSFLATGKLTFAYSFCVCI